MTLESDKILTLEDSISLLEILGQIPEYSPREAYRKPAPSPLAKLGIKTEAKNMSGLAWNAYTTLGSQEWKTALKKLWGPDININITKTSSGVPQLEATIGRGREKQTIGWWTLKDQKIARWRGAADNGSDDASEF